MPIYEYRCGNCGRKNSKLWLTISAAQAGENSLKCEKCGQPDLKRLVSRVVIGKAPQDAGEAQYDFDRMTANLDDADAGEMDRFTQSLGGEPSSGESDSFEDD